MFLDNAISKCFLRIEYITLGPCEVHDEVGFKLVNIVEGAIHDTDGTSLEIFRWIGCLSCGKGGFKDHVTVARHMSQPHSGCSMWLQDLICLRSESDDSRMDDEPNINMDDGPNIPDTKSGGFGDWDETF
ncbi:uncharacterized protein EDB91DRAFT_1080534 [Suillus paluster]|uniref:uncharacterized protein n=1 Tax=Suillus paluster TaxID=48578 RepID=UPI001B86F252|nr:uncharacterized protein EDB91DRAFT_1080534 [Suillus paluster]KAG1745012.1 hypothetical protein EDB91DRAFT_1080534 [Suillus paluster]